MYYIQYSMKKLQHKIENGETLKWCGKCKKWLPLDNFAKNKIKWDGLQERCSNCRREHWENKGKYTRILPSKEILKKKRRKWIINSYGITEEEYENLLKYQDNKCAICGTTDWGRPSPCIDHNHKTGEVRGLLCNRCNRTLGLANDSFDLLNLMVEYLKKHDTRKKR